MARIILIETSTALCSTALAEDGRIVAYKESTTPRAQASLTAPFVKEMLDACGIGVRDCDAVCVSKGPGSYTGLRVGVSTAKGLCFGAGIPLIAVGTLDILVYQAAGSGPCLPSDSGRSFPEDKVLLPDGCRYIVPMIDARRMEVYTSVFTPDGRQLTEIRPQIIAPGSFTDISWHLADSSEISPQNAAPESFADISHRPADRSEISPQDTAPESFADISHRPADRSEPGATSPSVSLAELLTEGPVLFIGDGADKCREALAHPNAHFAQCCPKASAMLRPAFDAWNARRFEDTAYFEPFYLKDFIATTPRKKLF